MSKPVNGRVLVTRIMIWCIASTLTADSTDSKHRLGPDDAALLITNTPSALRVRGLGGCPRGLVGSVTDDFAFVQLRNACPSKGMGMVGNYRVDLRTGRTWAEDSDPPREVDSKRLRDLRARLLSRLRR